MLRTDPADVGQHPDGALTPPPAHPVDGAAPASSSWRATAAWAATQPVFPWYAVAFAAQAAAVIVVAVHLVPFLREHAGPPRTEPRTRSTPSTPSWPAWLTFATPAVATSTPPGSPRCTLGNAIRRRVVTDHPEYLTDHFVFHVRTPSRKEIDFVSERLGGVAVEGRYTEGAWRSQAATVNASEWHGILATRNVLDTADATTAWAVPAGILAYLLDN